MTQETKKTQQTLVDEQTAEQPEMLGGPDTYQECCVPFPSAEAANEAIQQFWEEVFDLRCKYKLAHVSVIIKDQIAGSGGFITSTHAGNELEQESMAAWHLGNSSSNRQNIIRKAIGQGTEASLKQPENRK